MGSRAVSSIVSWVEFVTGTDGRYTFRGVPFGLYHVQPNRGAVVEVAVTRAEQVVRVPMVSGVDVTGRVVDRRGHGVAGARIWLTIEGTLHRRLPLAVADERGAFRAPRVTRGRYLTATAPGLLPGRLRAVPAEGPCEGLDLVLDESAGRLAIEVVDAAGQPVAGAALQIGASLPAPGAGENAKTRALRPPWAARTDAAGLAVCDQLPRDRGVALYVRAVGHAPRVLQLAAGGEPSRRIELARGASCSGTLTQDGDRAISAAVRAVRIGELVDYRTPDWFWPSCIASTDGSYRLVGLPDGDVLLQARSLNGPGAEAERTVASADAIEWSPRLGGGGGRIRGVVRGSDGAPPAGAAVRAIAHGSRARFAPLDAHGAFELGELPDRRFELAVVVGEGSTALVLARRHGVRIGAEIEIGVAAARLPTARVRGRLARLDLARVGLFEAGSGRHLEAVVDEQGAFEFGPVPAGDYRLLAGRAQIVLRRDLTLAPHAVADLGVVDATPPVDVTVQAPMATAAEPAELFVFADDCGPLLGYARLVGQARTLSLPVGACRFLLQRRGTYVAERRLLVDAAAAAVTLSAIQGDVARLVARPVAPCRELRVVWQIDGPWGRRRFVSTRSKSARATDPATLAVPLPPGDYVVRAVDGDGAAAEVPRDSPVARAAAHPPPRERARPDRNPATAGRAELSGLPGTPRRRLCPGRDPHLSGRARPATRTGAGGSGRHVRLHSRRPARPRRR